MGATSYRFLVTRDGDFPALGLLRDWAEGNEAALKHLESTYPGWTQITIQKILETPSEPSGQRRNRSGLQKSQSSSKGVCRLA